MQRSEDSGQRVEEQQEKISADSEGIRATDTPDRIARVYSWAEKTQEILALDQVPLDVPGILALSTDIANKVERPAVPVTSYIVGIRVGLEMAAERNGTESLDSAIQTILRELEAQGEKYDEK